MLRKNNLVVLAATLGLTVLASCGDTEDSSPVTAPAGTDADTSVAVGYQALAPAAADALLQNPPGGLVILDVRTPEEFAAGHIAGAVELDLQGATFESDVAELDPETPYFVYCHTDNRSGQAVAYLQQQGFSSLYELTGGIAAWQAEGLPVVTG
jgi:rhodanese-related sulfurtransferase